MEPAIQAILNTRNMVLSVSDHIHLLPADTQVRVSALPDNDQAFIGHRSHQNQPCNMPGIYRGCQKTGCRSRAQTCWEYVMSSSRIHRLWDPATHEYTIHWKPVWYLAVDEPQLSYQRFHHDNLSSKLSCFPLTLPRYLGSSVGKYHK